MDTVEEFLAHAVQLETDAALRFGQLADAMQSAGNREVSQLFRRLAHYSQLHLADAKERAGFRTLPELSPTTFKWPDIESPESAAIWATDPFVGREEALQVALEAETAGLDYYTDVMNTTQDPEIRAFAKEFSEEEAEHVAELKRWMALHQAGEPLPTGE